MIPANTYDGQPEAVPTVAITNILVTRDDVPDDVAYEMTRLIFENLTPLMQVIRSFSSGPARPVISESLTS